MASLYVRLLNRDDQGNPSPEPRIPVHFFSSMMGEVARGRFTNARANQIIGEVTGTALDAGAASEALTLLGTITGSAASKLARAKEIDDVLLLAEARVAEYDKPAEVKTRLGV